MEPLEPQFYWAKGDIFEPPSSQLETGGALGHQTFPGAIREERYRS